MINTDGTPGRTAEVNGKAYLFFSGFAYLGMPSLPAFRRLISEGAEKAGAVFPSSRISNTRSSLYDEFEEKLSAFVGLPASASFSSGYMASQAAVFFASQNSRLLYSPGMHPSLKIPGHPAPGPLSRGDWQQETMATVNKDKNNFHTIVTESVNPLSGEIHDFSWLAEIHRPVRLLVDDSHGIGILGARGEGVISHLPRCSHIRRLICYSLSKAFSCEGGAVTGEAEDIAAIKKLPWFTAATGMSPLFMYAWMQAQDLFAGQRKQLKDNIACLGNMITGIPFLHHNPLLPVCYIKEPGLYEHCLKHHILLSAFRYPSEQDALTARIVLNALHTPEDLDRLCTCLKEYFRTAGRTSRSI